MPTQNTAERPSSPTEPYMNGNHRPPNTPASHWSSSASSTPRYEPSQEIESNNPSPTRSQPQQALLVVPLVPTHTLVRRRPLQQVRSEHPQQIEQSQGTPVELRALDYVSVVDENLICPICRIALINPITTSCDHVFCRDCFDQSHRISPTCPIDRCQLMVPHDISPTHRLILNQLDGLEVKCPNSDDGCQQVLARSMVQNHVDKYCGYALVSCPEKSCEGLVLRRDLSSGCLHYAAICPDCAESILQVDMQCHRVRECLQRETTCDKCGSEILRCKADEHEKICEDAETSCKWAMYGCSWRSKRRELVDHNPDCEVKSIGPVVETLKGEISTLRSEVQFLNEKDKAKDRRIKFLESERSLGPNSSTNLGYGVPDISGLPDSSPSAMEYAPYDSRDQYLLSLLESQESRVDQMSAGMTELEAKQTMMLFNETIPIKEQLAELRSAQGVLGMHVRWLMNFRLQERRPGAIGGPSNEPKSGGGGPEFQSMRRSSDTMRELVTKL